MAKFRGIDDSGFAALAGQADRFRAQRGQATARGFLLAAQGILRGFGPSSSRSARWQRSASFRSSEAAKAREFRADENEKQRLFTQSRDEKSFRFRAKGERICRAPSASSAAVLPTSWSWTSGVRSLTRPRARPRRRSRISVATWTARGDKSFLVNNRALPTGSGGEQLQRIRELRRAQMLPVVELVGVPELHLLVRKRRRRTRPGHRALARVEDDPRLPPLVLRPELARDLRRLLEHVIRPLNDLDGCLLVGAGEHHRSRRAVNLPHQTALAEECLAETAGKLQPDLADAWIVERITRTTRCTEVRVGGVQVRPPVRASRMLAEPLK